MAFDPYDILSGRAGTSPELQGLMNAYGADIERLQSGNPLQSDIDRATGQAGRVARSRGIAGPLAAQLQSRAARGVQTDFMRQRDAQLQAARQFQAQMVAQAQQNAFNNQLQLAQLQEQRARYEQAQRQALADAQAARQAALFQGIGGAVGSLAGGVLGKSPEWGRVGAGGGQLLGTGLNAAFYNPNAGFGY